ncbi:MAG TPA: DUF2290 domain-containing protein [Bacteroidales bacterium]|nr:DUF2290 domain-containing protein [Bacteroidales bacterium]HQC59924.1 DUF2290 domain-containing protein [Bacteroidales bacterium]
MKKIKNDKSLLSKQITSIHKFYKNTSIANSYQMSIKNLPNASEFGIKNFFKASSNNYVEELNNCISQKKNFIQLSDKSIITFYYKLNDKGKIIEHSLSYIPFILDEENYVSNRLYEHYKDYKYYFDMMIDKYVRIDYSDLGYEEFEHSSVHMHLGLRDNIFRIPVYTYIYPYEFIYIILKHYYQNPYDSLEKLLVDLNKNRESTLSKLELSGMFLIIGNKL